MESKLRSLIACMFAAISMLAWMPRTARAEVYFEMNQPTFGFDYYSSTNYTTDSDLMNNFCLPYNNSLWGPAVEQTYSDLHDYFSTSTDYGNGSQYDFSFVGHSITGKFVDLKFGSNTGTQWRGQKCYLYNVTSFNGVQNGAGLIPKGRYRVNGVGMVTGVYTNGGTTVELETCMYIPILTSYVFGERPDGSLYRLSRSNDGWIELDQNYARIIVIQKSVKWEVWPGFVYSGGVAVESYWPQAYSHDLELYRVFRDIEETIEQQTIDIDADIDDQTDTLMDTGGSDTILTSLVDPTEFESKLGFIGQLGQVTSIFQNASSAEMNGYVHFPGIVVLGQTLAPEQDVYIWQGGLSTLANTIRRFTTFCIICIWVNGMKKVLEYQILGETYYGEDNEK